MNCHDPQCSQHDWAKVTGKGTKCCGKGPSPGGASRGGAGPDCHVVHCVPSRGRRKPVSLVAGPHPGWRVLGPVNFPDGEFVGSSVAVLLLSQVPKTGPRGYHCPVAETTSCRRMDGVRETPDMPDERQVPGNDLLPQWEGRKVQEVPVTMPDRVEGRLFFWKRRSCLGHAAQHAWMTLRHWATAD